jgi:hypothetical protein
VITVDSLPLLPPEPDDDDEIDEIDEITPEVIQELLLANDEDLYS